MANENDQKRGGGGGGSQSRGKSGGQGNEGGGGGRGVAGAVQTATDLGHTAVDKFQEFSEQASETYDQGRDQFNQFVEELRERATNEPLKTVLMATGVGIVLGVLFGCSRATAPLWELHREGETGPGPDVTRGSDGATPSRLLIGRHISVV
jgi:ElaB/YqjD/DUF883 family membrane-anchored ribosome-binding protein